MCYNVKLRRVRVTIFAVEKAICVTYTECVLVALDIRHAKLMCRIIVSSVAYSDLHYFSPLSHQRHNFRENVIEHKTLSLFTTYV